MTIEIIARRDLVNDPVFVKTEVITGEVHSAVTPDGRKFPAAQKDDGVVVIVSARRGEKLCLTLSEEKLSEGVLVKEQKDSLDILINGEKFTSYVYRGFIKPYLGPILTPDGSSYTRLDFETKEHPHQRSIIFAVGDVNGIDFWNETEHRGEERHQAVLNTVSTSAYGALTAANIWTKEDGTPVVDEKRTYTFYNQPSSCRCIDAEVTFTASYGEVRFGNTKEAGPLGVRVNESMRADHGGSFYNSYGAENEEECWGRAASWCDYRGMINEKSYGIAIFDNEDNERYPTTWHIRNYGLFAANNLYFKGGLTIKAGESLAYRYRLYFYEGKIDTAAKFLNYAK